MNALLLIAHGSRRQASNDEVCRLADRLRAEQGGRFDIVEPAFLELAEPNIPTGVDRCVELGATRITAVPYLLSAGRHVAEDIPGELSKALHDHPRLPIELSAHVGAARGMTDLVLEAAESTRPGGLRS